jgi:LPXTG-motif cell wall-anchored protein
MLYHTGFAPTIVQTLVEYSGLLSSVAAKITAVIDGVEAYVGQGNVKYILIGLLVVLLLMLIRRRR